MTRYPWGDEDKPRVKKDLNLPRKEKEPEFLVQFTMNEEGKKSLAWLAQNLDVKEPAKVVEAALKLLGVLVVASQNGEKILIQAEDGTVRQINFSVPSQEDFEDEVSEVDKETVC